MQISEEKEKKSLTRVARDADKVPAVAFVFAQASMHTLCQTGFVSSTVQVLNQNIFGTCPIRECFCCYTTKKHHQWLQDGLNTYYKVSNSLSQARNALGHNTDLRKACKTYLMKCHSIN